MSDLVETHGKRRRRIMKEFLISEISGVDEPAQAPAIMTIMKAKHVSTNAGEPGTGRKKKEDEMSTKTIEELQAELKKSANNLDKANAATKRSELFVQMSPSERVFMKGMSTSEEDTFMALSADDRGIEVTKAETAAADANPVIFKSKAGTEYRKDDDPRLVEMAKRDDAREGDMAKMRSDAADVHFLNKAKTTLTKFKGEDDTKVALLKAIAGITDEKSRGEVEKMVEGIHKTLGVVLKEVGTGADDDFTDDTDGNIKKASESNLDKLAKAYATENKVTFEKAYSAVMETEEGSKLYAQSVA